jgi:hypothetical protein
VVSNEPTFFSYVSPEELAAKGIRAAMHEATVAFRDEGCVFGRWTIVNDEHPNEPYPHGLYFEGWTEVPIPQPPFNYPLKAA